MVEQSKARVCGRSLAGIAGSNPAGTWTSVMSVVLSGRGLCDGPIPLQEESYRLLCVIVLCINLQNKAVLARVGLLHQRKRTLIF